MEMNENERNRCKYKKINISSLLPSQYYITLLHYERDKENYTTKQYYNELYHFFKNI